MIDGYWLPVRDGDARAYALYDRHYATHHYKDTRRQRDRRFVGPGEHMVLLTAGADALFVWRHMLRPDMGGQVGVACSIFRNESTVLSSDLIREACDLARYRWPDLRFFTYVGDKAIRSVNPGYCFKQAGWRTCGRNADGRLTILELLPAAERAA